jgi:hypothetical protein
VSPKATVAAGAPAARYWQTSGGPAVQVLAQVLTTGMGLQVPPPSQKFSLRTSSVQLLAQTVVAGQSWQLPLPSQSPSFPQPAVLVALQVPVGSAPFAGTLVQVPSKPLTPQLWQLGQLALPQQKPLTHAPFLH